MSRFVELAVSMCIALRNPGSSSKDCAASVTSDRRTTGGSAIHHRSSGAHLEGHVCLHCTAFSTCRICRNVDSLMTHFVPALSGLLSRRKCSSFMLCIRAAIKLKCARTGAGLAGCTASSSRLTVLPVVAHGFASVGSVGRRCATLAT